ncbi:MAG: protein translocase subunit SecF [Rickettsiales bacterium]|nr:protein translocase subunit SecF [Rickettsiales bacterium]
MILKTFWLRNFFADKTDINFLKVKTSCLVLSIFLMIAIFFGLYFRSLNFGIDFTGGILFEVRFSKKLEMQDLRHSLNQLGLGEINIQKIKDGNNDAMIRVGIKDETRKKEYIELIKNTLLQKMDSNVDFRKIEYVGAEVGNETIKKALISIILTFLGILAYIWYRFNLWYSIGIILGLIHDLIFTVGFLMLTQYEFNVTSVAAILAILGYSVNDTVVIYDRVRENARKFRKISFNKIINLSINETLSRTIFTSVTTLLAVAALILFGGEALQSFSITVFVGIIVGTYSSIFVSVPFLSFFNTKDK